MSIEDTHAQQLSAYALGLLYGPEKDELERELARSAVLQAELKAIQRALDDEADFVAPPISPSPELKQRLMTGLEAPEERYAPFLDRLSHWMELSVADMRDRIRDTIGSAMEWQATKAPGVSFVHFTAGPALAGVDTGFVRWAPHAVFPPHQHHGDELTFVLEGTLYFSGGQVLRPGDECIMPGGSDHSVWSEEEPVLIATIHRGFHILDSDPS